MTLFLSALTILGVSAGCAALAGRNQRWVTIWGVGGAVIGCFLGLMPAIHALTTGALPPFRAAWQVPYGEFFLVLDPLSAFFLLPIFGVSALAAIYGSEYLKPFSTHRSLGPISAWLNILIASMALVVAARNAVLFLVAWEVMSLASFFLVTFEDEREDVREAGWTYLVATHLGTAFLFVFFTLLGRHAGSMDFDQLTAISAASPTLAVVLFLLALVGFGTKAGFMPLHVWLPEAHPAAPSHVSAVMSGVMIKLGIYGILRTLTFLGPPPAWWGLTLLMIGVTSGVLGVAFALAQHDLKRLLAYHSVENIGIIALGMGIGLLGQSAGQPVMSWLGFSGALLHVLNHSLFKGLLFLGAGSVLHATGTRELDRLGGLFKAMPWTGTAFLVGATAICGLPPLNGFISEWLIYVGGFHGFLAFTTRSGMWLGLGIAALALIGGLAAACFAKAFGTVFLGSPREAQAHSVHEAGPAMLIPMMGLAGSCLAIGLWPHGVVQFIMPAISSITGASLPVDAAGIASTLAGLRLVSATAALLLCITLALVVLRRLLLKTRPINQAFTWGCGYAAPTAQMQYTASSFAQPLGRLFQSVLRTQSHEQAPAGYFPDSAHRTSHTPDVATTYLFLPLFARIKRGLEALRWLQQGRVQLYLLYIFLTLVVLLVWKLGV
ncbi:MAG: hydrogenase [Candidatus Omnitrophica bacterium]|nr:hydrogenase [Candidatus Omnitrophota bacterium]